MERWRDICLYPGRVRRGKITVRLTPIRWSIFRYLLSACGADVSKDRLMDVIYGCYDPPFDHVLYVHIWGIRKIIAPLGLRIVGRIGFGWYIIDDLGQD